MEQYQFLVILFLMALLVSPIFSQEEAEGSDSFGLEVRAGLTGSASISSSYPAPEVTVVYKPSLFGIGAGFRNY